MKKLFSKILSASIMFLCCMLSFVSFVKADGPDWLKGKKAEHELFSKLSKDSQEKLIALYKNMINKKEEYGAKKKLFPDMLKKLDSLEANPSKETDKQILPIVTGYVKKDDTIYINYSVLKKFTGYCESRIIEHFQKLGYKGVQSLDRMSRHESIKSLNLFGNVGNNYAYAKNWSIRVPFNYTRRPAGLPDQTQTVPINNNEGTDFPSRYVSPSQLLNNHTNTNTSLSQQLQVFLESLK